MLTHPISITPSQELESTYTSGVYPKRDLTIVKGKGAKVWDEEGREYFDCVAGIAVAVLGHANPIIVEALTKQAETLITCPGIFHNDKRAQLLEKLVEVTPASLTRGYLSNSGAEAVEAALKFARLATGRTQVISTMRGFHGRTMGALSLTGNPKYQKPFKPLVPDTMQVPYNKLEKLEAAISDQTAAIVIEVIQGEGGVRPADQAYIDGVKALCKENGALLIIDEIQTGFGRTGKFFACEHYDLEPDIMCLAKALGGGLPIGATMISEAVAEKLHPGAHGTTFGGNPLVCAVSLAVINAIQEQDLTAHAAEMGAYAQHKINAAEIEMVREVRGKGMIIGIELKQKVYPTLVELQQRGVLCVPAGVTTLRLVPPLVMTKDELDSVLDIIISVLDS